MVVLMVEELSSSLVPKKRLTLLFDHPVIKLSVHPALHNNMGFDEKDIWELLDCLVGALAFLQSNRCYHGDLNLENIY
jgi:serine/threonine protein kinase